MINESSIDVNQHDAAASSSNPRRNNNLWYTSPRATVLAQRETAQAVASVRRLHSAAS